MSLGVKAHFLQNRHLLLRVNLNPLARTMVPIGNLKRRADLVGWYKKGLASPALTLTRRNETQCAALKKIQELQL